MNTRFSLAAPLAAVTLMCLVLSGCATNDVQPSQRTGSSGDRVSPVRAAEINTRLGVGYMERGDLQIAMEKLEAAVRQDPEHVPAHLALGILYESIDRDAQALEHLRRAARLAPDDGAAQNSYAALLCRTGRYEEADRHFRRAMNDPFYATPEVVLANAGACARRGELYIEAEKYLRDALEIDPANRLALFNLSELFYQKGNALRARAFLQRLESIGPVGPDALWLGYRIESELNSAPDVERYAELLRGRYPDSPQASELRQQNRSR